MATVTADLNDRSISDLTTAVFGEPLTLDEVLARVPLRTSPSATKPGTGHTQSEIWIGSAGYERHRDSALFAEMLREQGVECLIDVRELPISRRRGYAKTALSEAMGHHGIRYVHAKSLGNPKPYRDLYKSGRVDEGRRAYRQLLLNERLEAVESIVPLLREWKCALMCVEHDEETCHRSVIFQALQNELGIRLAVAPLS